MFYLVFFTLITQNTISNEQALNWHLLFMTYCKHCVLRMIYCKKDNAISEHIRKQSIEVQIEVFIFYKPRIQTTSYVYDIFL